MEKNKETKQNHNSDTIRIFEILKQKQLNIRLLLFAFLTQFIVKS